MAVKMAVSSETWMAVNWVATSVALMAGLLAARSEAESVGHWVWMSGAMRVAQLVVR